MNRPQRFSLHVVHDLLEDTSQQCVKASILRTGMCFRCHYNLILLQSFLRRANYRLQPELEILFIAIFSSTVELYKCIQEGIG
jgi:hypothetical protein